MRRQRAQGIRILGILQRSNARDLGKGRDRPRLARCAHSADQLRIRTQAVAQAQTRHGEKLRERLEDDQRIALDAARQRAFIGIRQKVQKALVNCQQSTHLAATLQQPLQQHWRRHLTGGVARLADVDKVNILIHRIKQRLIGNKAALRAQHVLDHLAIHLRKRRLVLGKRRCHHQRLARAQRLRQADEQVGCPVAAQDLLNLDAMVSRKLSRELAAKRVGVRRLVLDRRGKRRFDRRRHPQRAEVGRIVERALARLSQITSPIASMSKHRYTPPVST